MAEYEMYTRQFENTENIGFINSTKNSFVFFVTLCFIKSKQFVEFVSRQYRDFIFPYIYALKLSATKLK